MRGAAGGYACGCCGRRTRGPECSKRVSRARPRLWAPRGALLKVKKPSLDRSLPACRQGFFRGRSFTGRQTRARRPLGHVFAERANARCGAADRMNAHYTSLRRARRASEALSRDLTRRPPSLPRDRQRNEPQRADDAREAPISQRMVQRAHKTRSRPAKKPMQALGRAVRGASSLALSGPPGAHTHDNSLRPRLSLLVSCAKALCTPQIRGCTHEAAAVFRARMPQSRFSLGGVRDQEGRSRGEPRARSKLKPTINTPLVCTAL